MPPSRYVGTSMGAVIATGLAAGLDPGAVAERLFSIRQRDVFAVDRTALLKGMWARALLKPEALRRTLERLLPVRAFSELRAPLSITATDIDTGAELTFGAGGEDVPLIDALCASCALPPFFPPFLLRGKRCADGGLREVVPLAVAVLTYFGRSPALRTCVQKYVWLSPGASVIVPVGVSVPASQRGSLRTTSSDTFPVFFTTILYSTV